MPESSSADEVAKLRQHIKWSAQTVHQAYHRDVDGGWQDCMRDVCQSSALILSGRK